MRPSGAPAEADIAIVTWQLGRPARGAWMVDARCSWGRPTVVVTEPILSDGRPFPTLLWLTCPWLCQRAAARESAGDTDQWRARLAAEPELADRMRVADGAYWSRRAQVAGGIDPCAGTGVAGQRDPLATKCLHAHVAAALGGLADPIGLALLATGERACPDDRCAGALVESDA